MQFRKMTFFLKVVEVGLLQSSSKALFSTTQITVSVGSRRATYLKKKKKEENPEEQFKPSSSPLHSKHLKITSGRKKSTLAEVHF